MASRETGRGGEPTRVPTQTGGPERAGWVSKTDLIRYVRCPYAFWLLDRGEIGFRDTVDDFGFRLLVKGAAFHRLVQASARVEVHSEDLPSLLRKHVTLLGTPAFENHDLKIRGRPDGVNAAGGILAPIEIKAHKHVHRTDELELAFYWLVLEPYRTRDTVQPFGYLLLRRDGGAERVEVPIGQPRLDEVRRLVGEVRETRRNDVLPRMCRRCTVCRQVKSDEVRRVTEARKDLTLIFGIGPTYARALEEIGVATWEHLVGCDSEMLAEEVRGRGHPVSTGQIERWKRHAEAWERRQPVFFGDGACVGDSFIALDLEYGSDRIWLVGVCVVAGGGRQITTLWADDEREERQNLRTLGEVLSANPALPVVTWSGETADLPQLRSAGRRLGLDGHLDAVFRRHVDLFLWAKKSVRLPVPGLGLKEVARHFGVRRDSPVDDGLQAQAMYREYRSSKNRNRRAELRGHLEQYVREDLGALVATAKRLRELGKAAGTPRDAGAGD